MARFIVRVEMLAADSDDYASLHTAMESAGYSREIQGSGGDLFHLPTAEYTVVKSSTASQIREEVKLIAQKIRSKFYVLVSECSDTAWWLPTK